MASDIWRRDAKNPATRDMEARETERGVGEGGRERGKEGDLGEPGESALAEVPGEARGDVGACAIPAIAHRIRGCGVWGLGFRRHTCHGTTRHAPERRHRGRRQAAGGNLHERGQGIARCREQAHRARRPQTQR